MLHSGWRARRRLPNRGAITRIKRGNITFRACDNAPPEGAEGGQKRAQKRPGHPQMVHQLRCGPGQSKRNEERGGARICACLKGGGLPRPSSRAPRAPPVRGWENDRRSFREKELCKGRGGSYRGVVGHFTDARYVLPFLPSFNTCLPSHRLSSSPPSFVQTATPSPRPLKGCSDSPSHAELIARGEKYPQACN